MIKRWGDEPTRLFLDGKEIGGVISISTFGHARVKVQLLSGRFEGCDHRRVMITMPEPRKKFQRKRRYSVVTADISNLQSCEVGFSFDWENTHWRYDLMWEDVV